MPEVPPPPDLEKAAADLLRTLERKSAAGETPRAAEPGKEIDRAANAAAAASLASELLAGLPPEEPPAPARTRPRPPNPTKAPKSPTTARIPTAPPLPRREMPAIIEPRDPSLFEGEAYAQEKLQRDPIFIFLTQDPAGPHFTPEEVVFHYRAISKIEIDPQGATMGTSTRFSNYHDYKQWRDSLT